jgi:hypothetical protein
MSDKIRKLWKQAQKTGFPLEIEVIETLMNKGWTVYSSFTYFDEDEDRKPRELDVKAIKDFNFGQMSNFSNTHYSLQVKLTIQCKQSDNRGWVFFPFMGRRDSPNVQFTDFIHTIKEHTLFLSNPRKNPADIRRFIGLTPSLLNEPPLISQETASSLGSLSREIPYNIWDIKTLTHLPHSQTGVSLGFEGKTYQDLFEAAMTSTKPSLQERDLQTFVDYHLMTKILERVRYGGEDFGTILGIGIFIPLIVFRGEMCFWKGYAEPPEEIDQVGYHFMNRSPNYLDRYFIPVVKSNVFAAFISSLESDFEKLAKRISDKTDYIDSQIQKILEDGH